MSVKTHLEVLRPCTLCGRGKRHARRPHRGGSGTHLDRRQRRIRTRADQRRAAFEVAVHCAQRKESQEIVPTGGEELVR